MTLLPELKPEQTNTVGKWLNLDLSAMLRAIERFKEQIQPVIYMNESSDIPKTVEGFSVKINNFMPKNIAWVVQEGKLIATMEEKEGKWEARVYDDPLSLSYSLDEKIIF